MVKCQVDGEGHRAMNAVETRIRSAIRLTIVASMALLVSLLGGCGPESSAPTPTLNPHADKTITILVSVSDPHVDNVKVASTWQLGNFKCAPVIWPEGYLKDPPISVAEKVIKFGSNYKASMLLDRFKHDKCNWFLAVSEIDFMSNGEIYALYGFDTSEMTTHYRQKITCMPSSVSRGICVRRQLNAAEKHIEHKFDATVEYLP